MKDDWVVLLAGGFTILFLIYAIVGMIFYS